MERDTLIKVFTLVLVAAFMLELFSMRSSVTNTTSLNSTTPSQEPSLYGTGQTSATLLSYKEYLNVFKAGRDLTINSSLGEIRDIDGVGYLNRQGGALIVVLDQSANVPLIASEIEQMFPDLNVTAVGQFELPPTVEFTTSEGKRNVSMNAVIELEIEPNILPSDNVTLSLIGLVSGDNLAGSPVAKVIPTQGEALANATIKEATYDYGAVAIIPWGSRNLNASRIREALSNEVWNLSMNYSPRSFVLVNGLDSASDEIVKKVENLSYVTGVFSTEVDLRDEMNDSEKLGSDIKGILGDNTTIDYPSSVIEMTFHSENLSKDGLFKSIGWTPVVYRRMSIEVSGKLNISGVEYDVPSNTTFDEMLVDSYSVGQQIGVWLDTGTIGRRIVNLKLDRIAQ
ncbi:MAG: hypothetical protein NTY73_02075 [Candidatus Micrarchaeota archaeon]|nr:hypothetical protein [Candidatus Micrarchaeota archaeon]